MSYSYVATLFETILTFFFYVILWNICYISRVGLSPIFNVKKCG